MSLGWWEDWNLRSLARRVRFEWSSITPSLMLVPNSFQKVSLYFSSAIFLIMSKVLRTSFFLITYMKLKNNLLKNVTSNFETLPYLSRGILVKDIKTRHRHCHLSSGREWWASLCHTEQKRSCQWKQSQDHFDIYVLALDQIVGLHRCLLRNSFNFSIGLKLSLTSSEKTIRFLGFNNSRVKLSSSAREPGTSLHIWWLHQQSLSSEAQREMQLVSSQRHSP